MKKTNRFIALLTALVLVFSTLIGTTAFAAVNTDVVGTDFETAVGKLSAVGIMQGYPDGTFLPNGEITRAEFAKIAVLAFGLGDAAAASAGTTKFADVPASHWASGYINLAANKSLITGYPDGTFKPEGKITNAEAITILCRLVGLGPVVDKAGTWPANYIGRAANEGILDGVNVASGTNATRGLVAKMLVNTLTVDVWGATGYEDDGSVNYGKTGETLLTDKLNITEYNSDLEDADGDKLYDEVRVEFVDIEENEATLSDEGADIGTFEVKEGVDVDLYNIYLNEVNVWVNDDDQIIYAEIESKSFVDAITINEDGDEVTLEGLDKTYDLNLDTVWADTDALNGDDATDVVADDEFDLAKVVLNSKNEVVFIDAYEWDDYVAVKSLDKTVVTNLDDEEIDFEDYMIMKDGQLISTSDVKANDMLYYVTDSVTFLGKDFDGFAEVFNGSVTGAIEKIYNDAFVVKGTEYDYLEALVAAQSAEYLDDDAFADFDQDAADLMEGEGDVTVYLDRQGDAVYVTGKLGTAVTNDVAGLLLEDVSFDVAFGKGTLEFVYFSQDAKKVTKSVKVSDLDLISYNGNDYEVGEDHPAVATEIDKFELVDHAGTLEITPVDADGADIGAVFFDVETPDAVLTSGAVVQFTYDESGNIVELTFADGAFVEDLNANLDVEDDNYAEGNKIDDADTIVFDITDCIDAAGNVTYDEDNISVAKWGDVKYDEIDDIFDGTASDVDSLVYRNADNEALYIVAASTNADEDTTDVTGLLASFRENSDDEVVKVVAWVDEVEKTYTVDAVDVALTAGLVYTLTVDENGVVTEIVAVFDDPADLDPDDRIIDGTVTGFDTGDKTIEVDGVTYDLVSGHDVIDITDGVTDGAAKNLINVALGDTVTVVLDEAGTSFVSMVVIR